MKKLRFLLPILILGGSIAVFWSVSFGKSEYTKKEGKACTYCHVKAASKELNDVGKCYQEKKSLQGCEPKKTEENEKK